MRLLLPLLATCAAAAAEFAPLDPAKTPHPASEAAPAASPTTYDDAAGFAARGALIIDGLKGEDLQKWRTGYFAGGDPGKYLPGAAMAKLLADPADAMARRYLNDDRSFKEQYHFAAVNWARTLPLFGAALTDETRQKVAAQAAKTAAYLNGTGTENHRTMWYTSALVLPSYLAGDGTIGNTKKADALAKMKEWLRGYVRNLYHYGQGEWDSCTYLAFDLNGFLNLYDFAEDPEVRLLAKAGLDWYIAAYALKYTDGIFCAPHQRGGCDAPAESITDQIGWLWWGSSKPMTAADCANFRYSLHAYTSSWRPGAALSNIARKRLPGLPSDGTSAKPNYYMGQVATPKGGVYPEVQRQHPDYTLCSLLAGHGGQMMRWQLVAPGDAGPLALSGGSPMGRNDGDGSLQSWKWLDGNGLYDRTVQVGGTLISLTRIPDDQAVAAQAAQEIDARIASGRAKAEERAALVERFVQGHLPFAFLNLPAGVTPEPADGGWWLLRLNRCWVGVRPLGAEATVGDAPLPPGAKPPKNAPPRLLTIPGRRVGFVVVALGGAPADRAAAAAALASVAIDLSGWDADQAVALTTPEGRRVTARWSDERAAAATVDGQPLALPTKPYETPWVRCVDGVLTITDGSTGWVVDFSGDMPVYRNWTK